MVIDANKIHDLPNKRNLKVQALVQSTESKKTAKHFADFECQTFDVGSFKWNPVNLTLNKKRIKIKEKPKWKRVGSHGVSWAQA